MSRDETATTKTDTVPVFINRRKIELPPGAMTIPTLLTEAGFEGMGWDILELQGEGDPTGGTLLMADATAVIKAGLHFRVLPGNRTFGTGRARRRKEASEGKTEARA